MIGPQAQAQDGAEELTGFFMLQNFLIGAGIVPANRAVRDIEDVVNVLEEGIVKMLAEHGRLKVASVERQKWGDLRCHNLETELKRARNELDTVAHRSAKDKESQDTNAACLAEAIGGLRSELLEALQALQLAEPTQQRGQRITQLLEWAAARARP